MTFDYNFGKCSVDRFTKFFHCQITEEIFLYACIIKILHITLNVFLHYVVKLDNYNCCRFQRHIACDTSEFMLHESNYKVKMQDYRICKSKW